MKIKIITISYYKGNCTYSYPYYEYGHARKYEWGVKTILSKFSKGFFVLSIFFFSHFSY